MSSWAKYFAADSNRNFDQWVTEFARPLVFTNGCFDILHRGHIDYLEKAAALGESLIVGVNTDASVKKQDKGSDRPFNVELDRIALLCALECVQGVVLFDQPTPLEMINQIRPDILVKGGDWSTDNIVGATEVRSWGGTVHSIEFAFQRSTTSLVERIRQS